VFLHSALLKLTGCAPGMAAKRLEKGRFVWPPIVEGALQLTAAQLALLIEGIDWRRTVAPQAPERPDFLEIPPILQLRRCVFCDRRNHVARRC
jgi:transposase